MQHSDSNSPLADMPNPFNNAYMLETGGVNARSSLQTHEKLWNLSHL